MRTLSALLLCLLATACDAGSAPPTSTSTPAATSPSAPRTSAVTSSTPGDGAALECGDDFSALDQVGPPSVPRQCFLEANAAGKPAVLTVHGVRATGQFTASLRSNADRTVEVVPADGGPPSTCTGLARDDRRVFRLAGCDPPLPGE